MLDDKLTSDIQSWLDSPAESRPLEAGAELLLRLNRNRYMHAQIIRRRNFAKLEYELQKHLRIRLEGLTARDVAVMERDALPAIEKSLDEARPVISTDADLPEGDFHGKRPDHDSLPADLQKVYERNGIVYFKMKQLFETLKGMGDATPCDRHELLLQLVELDREYRENWLRYDTWSAVANGDVAAAPASSAPTAQQIQAARKYISNNKPKLASAVGGEAEALRDKMQQRISLLLSAGQGFDSDYRSELEALGLDFN